MVRRYALRDGQWEKIERLLPGRENTAVTRGLPSVALTGELEFRWRGGLTYRHPHLNPKLRR